MPNQIVVYGRLGQDAELKALDRSSVLSFSLASDVGYGDKKSTLWLRCSLWGKRGENLLDYMTKGTAVCACGSLSQREWEDKEGNARTTLEVTCQDVWLVGSKPAAAGSSAPAKKPGSAPAVRKPGQTASKKPTLDDPETEAAADFDSDDIPF